MACCPPETGFFSALMSNSCSWCTSADQAAQATLLLNPNNKGNTSGVPCCDPNDGFFTNLFSNTCNSCNPIGDAVGLSSIPSWVLIAGGAVMAMVVLRGK